MNIEKGNVYTHQGKDSKWRILQVHHVKADNIRIKQYGKTFSQQPTWSDVSTKEELDNDKLSSDQLDFPGITVSHTQSKEWILLGHCDIEDDFMNFLDEM